MPISNHIYLFILCSDEVLTLETSAKILFTAFSITSTLRRYIVSGEGILHCIFIYDFSEVFGDIAAVASVFRDVVG